MAGRDRSLARACGHRARAVAAAAIGYEMCAATARLLGPEARRFWHPAAVAGVVGAAAAAEWIEGEGTNLVDAVGHALSLAGGSIVCMLERSDTRFVHRAHAAGAGLLAARSAAAGLAATRFGVESPRGFLAAFQSSADPQAAAGGSGVAIAEVAYRLHGASGFAHGAIDAARRLAPLEPGDITGLAVDVSPAAAALAGSLAPAGDDDAWWSVPHAVAVALTDGSSRGVPRRSEHVPRDAAARRALRAHHDPERSRGGGARGARVGRVPGRDRRRADRARGQPALRRPEDRKMGSARR